MFQDLPDAPADSALTDRDPSQAFLDLVERGKELARSVGARRFSIVLAKFRDGRLSLRPYLDSSFPGLSALSRSLIAPGGEVERHLTSSCAEPAIFSASAIHPTGEQRSCGSALVADETSVVFPVHARCGRRGLVALSGLHPMLDEEGLMRAHLRAFGLFRAACALRAPEPGRIHPLSRRDIECLRLTADGLTSEQIAERLSLSVHTANQYISTAVEKMDAVNRMHAVAKALRAGIIS